MTASRACLVTGGNRGLGFAVLMTLIGRRALDDVFILCCRDPKKGRLAAEQLVAEATARGGPPPVIWVEALDVTSATSHAALAERLVPKLEAHNTILDRLVLNAGFAGGHAPIRDDDKRVILETNVNSLEFARNHIFSLLTPRSRVVVMGSGAAQFAENAMHYSLRKRFDEIADLTQWRSLFAEFAALTARDALPPGNPPTEKHPWPSSNAPGFPNNVYNTSKLFVHHWVRLTAPMLPHPSLLATSSPGWCHTDMGGKDAPLTPEQGADTAVWLLDTPDANVVERNGRVFGQRSPEPFGLQKRF